MPTSHDNCKRQVAGVWLTLLLLAAPVAATAQHFALETQSDSLSWLVLNNDDGTTDRHKLTFPVYQFCVGDVDGDGSEDALVGVVKTTRFDPNMARRLFIFKNHKGHIRALWMGSRLGGILEDFTFRDGRVLSLQSTKDHKYVVLEHEWRKFGLGAKRFIRMNVTLDEARQALENEPLSETTTKR